MKLIYPLTGGLLLAALAHQGVAQARAHPGIARANTSPILRTVEVGIAPSTVTVDEHTRRAFVINQGPPYTASILDSATGTVLRTVSGGSHRLDTASSSVAVDVAHNRVLILNQSSAGVNFLDATTGRLLGVTPLDFPPQLIAVDAMHRRAFIPNNDDEDPQGGVEVLDTVRMRTVREVPIHGDGIAADERTGHVFVSSATGVSMFDGVTGCILRKIRVIGAPVAVDSGAHRVFILKGSPRYTTDFSLTVLDTRTGAVVRALQLPLESTYSLVVDPRRSRAFLAIGHSIYVLNTLTGRQLHSIIVGPSLTRFAGSPLAVDGRSGNVYAVSSTLDRYGSPSGPGYMRVFDPGTGGLVRTIRVSPHPSTIAIDNWTRRIFIVQSAGGITTQSSRDNRGSVTVLDASRL